jgi:hypothetical protein
VVATGNARVDDNGDREGSTAAGREEMRHQDTDLGGDELDPVGDDG